MTAMAPELERRTLSTRPLTVREREVLERMAMGWSNARIGADLYLSPMTVKTHARRIQAKLNTRGRAHSVAEGVRSGQLTLQLVVAAPQAGGRA